METSAAGRQNVHLPYDQRCQVHHRVVAGLVHKYTAEGRVVDVGCGLGYTLLELRRLAPGLKLHAADADEVCLQRTAEMVPGVTAIRMRADRFDIESLGSGYAACILSHLLEHLPRPLDAIHGLLGLLRPGGHLILAVPNAATPVVLWDAVCRRARVNPGHLYVWDRPHWINFLENWVDAEVVEYASDEVRTFPGSWRRRIRLVERTGIALARLLPWCSFSNIAVLRRPEDAA